MEGTPRCILPTRDSWRRPCTCPVGRTRAALVSLLLALAWLIARHVPMVRPLVWGALFHRGLDYTWSAALSPGPGGTAPCSAARPSSAGRGATSSGVAEVL